MREEVRGLTLSTLIISHPAALAMHVLPSVSYQE
jgi:hypothetical protein